MMLPLLLIEDAEIFIESLVLCLNQVFIQLTSLQG